jgi:hypothetical protein
VLLCAPFSHAEQLSSDAKASIPHDVQQIIMVDYRAMQNSPAAMSLKDRVMPPELKRLEEALMKSGLKVDSDTDALAFVSFRTPNPDGKGAEAERIVGIAQGQFHTHDILANFTKNKTKPVVIRNNDIYPMGSNGLSVVFLNQTTMVFGDKDAIKAAVDSRDGTFAELSDRQRPGERDGRGRQPHDLEPAGRQGHTADDAERAGHGVTACRLRHGEEPDEELALHHGLLEWGEVQHELSACPTR